MPSRTLELRSCLPLVLAVINGRLQIAVCGGSGQTFTFNGVNIQTTADPSRCLDLQFGDLAAGVADITGCNGTLNQQWAIVGGQIASANRSDGQTHCPT